MNMNLNESIVAIKSLLEYKVIDEIGKSFESEEVSIGDRTFVITGSVSATLIDDSDYDRETGYGRMVYPSDFEYDVKEVIEVLEDGTETDVSGDVEVISMVEEYMRESLQE